MPRGQVDSSSRFQPLSSSSSSTNYGQLIDSSSSLMLSSSLSGSSSAGGVADTSSASSTTLFASSSCSASGLFPSSKMSNLYFFSNSSQAEESPPVTNQQQKTTNSNRHHVLTKSPKLFLKKQDKKKLQISQQSMTNPMSSTTMSSMKEKGGVVYEVDSIRFERKAICAKRGGEQQAHQSSPAPISDDFLLRHRLSCSSSTLSLPPPCSTRRPAGPLRCLLDSGEQQLPLPGDRGETPGEFRAFVVAEKSRQAAQNDAAAYFTMFERNRTSDEFCMRQKEAYNRFRSNVAGSHHRSTTAAAQPTGISIRHRQSLDLLGDNSLIMINTKIF